MLAHEVAAEVLCCKGVNLIRIKVLRVGRFEREKRDHKLKPLTIIIKIILLRKGFLSFHNKRQHRSLTLGQKHRIIQKVAHPIQRLQQLLIIARIALLLTLINLHTQLHTGILRKHIIRAHSNQIINVVIGFEEEVFDADAAGFAVFAADREGGGLAVDGELDEVEVGVGEQVERGFGLAEQGEVFGVEEGLQVVGELGFGDFGLFYADLQAFWDGRDGGFYCGLLGLI